MMSTPMTPIVVLCLCAGLASAGCKPGSSGAELTAAVASAAVPQGTAEATGGTGDGSASAPAGQAPLLEPGFAATTMRQEELRGIAMSSIQSGDNNRAIAALISLMETPEMSELKASGMLLLAELYHNEGNSDRALAILQDLIAHAPPMAEFEFMLGRTLAELDRGDDAVEHLREAIELNPEFLQSYLLLGSVLVQQGHQDEAAPIYAHYETALSGLLARLQDTSLPLQDRLDVADTLATANPDARITQVLLGLLQGDDVVMQATAIQLLARLGTNDAVPALVAFAGQTSHPELSAAAQQAAQMIGSPQPQQQQ
jgi:Flp pilus assembly protein TadD